MGPRSEERGNSDPPNGGGAVFAASMGPRSEERGNSGCLYRLDDNALSILNRAVYSNTEV